MSLKIRKANGGDLAYLEYYWEVVDEDSGKGIAAFADEADALIFIKVRGREVHSNDYPGSWDVGVSPRNLKDFREAIAARNIKIREWVEKENRRRGYGKTEQG